MKRLMSAWPVVLLAGCVTGPIDPVDLAGLQQQVRVTELAFAGSMSDRDFDAFQSFIADDAIFLAGPNTLRGKAVVVAAWSSYFQDETAPFSWEPETVVVQSDGGLALSSGPVRAADGRQIGIFTSIWRREKDGVWRIIFDKGGCACD